MTDYIVLRQHYGDKQYHAGDTRTVTDEYVAKQLIEQGLIADKSAQKAEKPTQNKAKPAPKNKAVDDGAHNDK